jgi:FAD/FMN-containing dehydrogenase
VTSAQQQRIAAAGCEVLFDNLTRQLYATDASIYQIEPVGVAFPSSAPQASAAIRAAADANISVTLAGPAPVYRAAPSAWIDCRFSRHNREIHKLIRKRTIWVGAGVILDQNACGRAFCFGPDVATSSRATIGEMVANNRPARTSNLRDHRRSVIPLEIMLADGRVRG